jgi:hypothetical protein
MTNEEKSAALDSYLAVTMSFAQGFLRICSAEAASARLMIALLEYRMSGRAGIDGEAVSALKELDAIPYSSYDSLRYVTDVSHLVYATTLLDTFLSDTTMFLFLLFPNAMGKNQQIPLRTLINAASRNDALTKAAAARARSIGYLAFDARIQFLRETFGLAIVLDPNSTEALVHYSSIRNTAVHDQGIFDLRLDDGGRVSFRQKSCPRHPTQIRSDDAMNAIKAYQRVVAAVAEAVITQALKEPHNPALDGLLGRAKPVEEKAASVEIQPPADSIKTPRPENLSDRDNSV